jgi:hypothetical protein
MPGIDRNQSIRFLSNNKKKTEHAQNYGHDKESNLFYCYVNVSRAAYDSA